MIPNHIAIIMDGNRRWAREHKLAIIKGHEYAAKNVLEKIIEHAAKTGVKYVTFWAFSTENWQRNKQEVDGLLNILRWSLKEKVQTFIKKGVKLKIIGDLTKFPKDIIIGIEDAVEKTKEGKNITVVLAVNYGGRDEIIRAINKWNKKEERHSGESRKAGRLQNRFWTSQNDDSGNLTEEQFSHFLDTKDLPDPDLIIRTGGEQRLSGFLSWQAEYAELYFTDILWPDFSADDLDLAIADYQKRQRRFGR